MKKSIGIALLLGTFATGRLHAQTVSFNFSATSQAVTGWINVVGDPSTAVRTATDATTGIAISSIATANWAPFGAGCAYDGGGTPGGTFFPAAVMMNEWYQYSTYYALYNALLPQLKISGLNIDSVYTLRMTGSFNGENGLVDANPTRFSVAGTSVYGYIDVNADFNTAGGAVFHNIAPDATGSIRVYVNTFGGSTTASINGIQVIRERVTSPTPIVHITAPSNNDIIPEDGNVTISATATETGGTIARVEFYADTTLIGVDSTSPYSMVWINPDPGKYTLTDRKSVV